MGNIERNLIKNNSTELQIVEDAMKATNNKRMFIRYQAVNLHLKGKTNVEISNIIRVGQHAVGKYINAYKAKGLAGLVMGKSTGAPRRLTKEQEQEVFEVVTTQIPDEVGFPTKKNWDSTLVREWIKNNFKVEYSPRAVLYLLHRLNLSFTRPTYTLAKADPKKQEEFREAFDLLKKSY